MKFKDWLLITESVIENFDNWLKSFRDNAPAAIKVEVESLTIPEDKRKLISDVLSEYSRRPLVIGMKKVKEDQNWFRFALGYYKVKPNMFREDLERAIDIILKKISSNEITNSEIGVIGWYGLGKRAKSEVENESRKLPVVSKTASEKMKLAGKTFPEDEVHIEKVASENGLVLYVLPPLVTTGTKFNQKYNREIDEYDKDQIEARHRILCSYGKSTNWCTASATGEYHEGYAGEKIYILHYNGVARYQFNPGDSDVPQFMDINDDVVFVMLPFELNFLKKHLRPIDVRNIEPWKFIEDDVTAATFLDVLGEKLKSNDFVNFVPRFSNYVENIVSQLDDDRTIGKFLESFSVSSNKEELAKNIEKELAKDYGLMEKFLKHNSYKDLNLSPSDLFDQIEAGNIALEDIDSDDLYYLVGYVDSDYLLEIYKLLSGLHSNLIERLIELGIPDICNFLEHIDIDNRDEASDFFSELFEEMLNKGITVSDNKLDRLLKSVDIMLDNLNSRLRNYDDDKPFKGVRIYRYLLDLVPTIEECVKAICEIGCNALVYQITDDLKPRIRKGEDLTPSLVGDLMDVNDVSMKARKEYLELFIKSTDAGRIDLETLKKLVGFNNEDVSLVQKKELTEKLYSILDNPHEISGSEPIWGMIGY